MIQADIEATLPNQLTLPEPIAAICDYLDKFGYPISGCFELSTIGVEDLKVWFTKSPGTVSTFMPFGRGATGDVYALWLINGLEPDVSPVVMFGSEGLLQVLATTPLEFCRLLCVGYNELGYDDASKPVDNQSAVQSFRDYMQKRFRFEVPETGAQIIAAATAAHPNFRQWVEALN